MAQADIGGGRGWGDPRMVASIHRIDADLGRPLQITSAGRDAKTQQELLDRWNRGDRAGLSYQPASPTSSLHVKGLAIDSDDHEYLAGPKGQAHGFTHPVAGDYPHFVYDPAKDKYNSGTVANPFDALNPLTPWNKVATTLGDRNTWIRIGIGALGVGLLIVAIVRIFNASELGQELTKAVGEGARDVKTAAKVAAVIPK